MVTLIAEKMNIRGLDYVVTMSIVHSTKTDRSIDVEEHGASETTEIPVEATCMNIALRHETKLKIRVF